MNLTGKEDARHPRLATICDCINHKNRILFTSIVKSIESHIFTVKIRAKSKSKKKYKISAMLDEELNVYFYWNEIEWNRQKIEAKWSEHHLQLPKRILDMSTLLLWQNVRLNANAWSELESTPPERKKPETEWKVRGKLNDRRVRKKERMKK